jgi:cardiolipin synthase A/B
MLRARASAGAVTCIAAGPGPGLTRVGALIIEPSAGFSPVYGLINGARHSIDVTMSEFGDITAEHDLATAARRGVKV